MHSLLLLLLTTLISPSLSSSHNSSTVCNADDCLRALRRHSTSASPFCNTYIAPSTITHTASTTKTIHPIISPFFTTSPSTPLYATPCTSPARLSSACSCLLSLSSPVTTPITITVPTATATATATATNTTPVCDSKLNDGIQYALPTFADLIHVEKHYPPLTDGQGLHACCAVCYQTPGCLTFGTGSGNQTGIRRCELSVAAEGSFTGPGVSDECPFGVYLGFNKLGKDVGLGPCVDWRGEGGGLG
ncbi:MAG: hypothetical protein LQ343_004250 [Gyalolechia ehrenbergii]|nr:MAG: hypothetical protein LQ343_004250 [Gyalolechia ehrenbergii]